MADQDRVGEIQVIDQRGEVGGQGVEVIAMPGPVGATVTATVVDDATQSSVD